MLTKYILTVGSTEHVIPDECLKNWDEISFSLKRTDYSGVMRSFSTEFQFVGEIADLLWQAYLEDGFLDSASVAVYTLTNTHTWAKQFEETLDFSSLEMSDGTLTINAFDNTLGAKIKAKKSQKYEYPISDFSLTYTRVNITRLELKSYAHWAFAMEENNYYAEDYGAVCMRLVSSKSVVISKAYLEPFDQSNGDDGSSDNSFFMQSHAFGATMRLKIHGHVRCYLDPDRYGEARLSTVHDASMRIMYNTENDQGYNRREYSEVLVKDDIAHKVIDGVNKNMMYGGALDIVAGNVQELENYSGEKPVGFFGVVGSNSDPSSAGYWSDNVVYEWDGASWVLKGTAGDYYQDRLVDITYDVPPAKLMNGTYVSVVISGKMFVVTGGGEEFSVHADWSDPVENALSVRGLTPLQLATRLVQSIQPGATVSIDADAEGLIATTVLVAGEELRGIGTAKIYSTFQQFCEFMECVFGYTYAIEGNNVRFAHRSALFDAQVSKIIADVNGVEYSVNDGLIYSEIDVGFAKKDYSEIDGRYEKNFMNYYSTGFDLTDKKCTLSSKYRADSYGIEFTARKSESDTTDDKADEDIFFVHYHVPEGGVNTYEPEDNDVYNPSSCVTRNGAYLAAMGNGAEVTLTMTSSDGDNELDDVVVSAGDNLFTAGELEFTTDDMVLPGNFNALVQVGYEGFRYKGFIKEAECRYGRLNGMKYKLIIKEITEI